MSFERTPPSRPQRRKKLTRLSGLTERLISPALSKKSRYFSELVANWPQIAGPINEWARPSDLRPPTSAETDGTLILSIHSGRGPQALAMSQDIIERVNRHFGFTLITYVNVKQDLSADATKKVKDAPPSAAQKAPPSASLEEALEKLGHAINAKEKQ